MPRELPAGRRSLRRSRRKAVNRHFEVLVFAVGRHDRIDLLLNLFYGRAFPDADALGTVVSGGIDREFEGRRDALFQGSGYGFLETGRIVDVVNGDNVHRVIRFYWGVIILSLSGGCDKSKPWLRLLGFAVDSPVSR